VKRADSLSGYREEAEGIGFSQILLGREREACQIASVRRSFGWTPAAVEFSLVIGIICVGVRSGERRRSSCRRSSSSRLAPRIGSMATSLLDYRANSSWRSHPAATRVVRSKSGRRFSRTAANPRATSASLKPRNSSASDRRNWGRPTAASCSAHAWSGIAVVLPAATCVPRRTRFRVPGHRVRHGDETDSFGLGARQGLVRQQVVSRFARPQSSGQMMTA